MEMNPNYPMFDRQGNPIDFEQYAHLVANLDYKRVAEDTIGPIWISTVWLGINHNWDFKQPPLIFESMAFNGNESPWKNLIDRYSTEAQALAGHDQMVTKVRELLADTEDPDEDLSDDELKSIWDKSTPVQLADPDD